MKKTLMICSFVAGLLLAGIASASAQKKNFVIDFADSYMRQTPALADIGGKPKSAWRYDVGMLARAYLELSEATGNKAYYEYMKAFSDAYVNPDGSVRNYKIEEYNIDRVQPARNLVLLHRITGDDRYKKAADLFVKQMEGHPRNADNGWWHKNIYPHQMWLDGLYMASPFVSLYAKNYGEPKWFDEVVLQLRLAYKHTRDPKTGLLFHAWDESRSMPWCDSATGLSRNVWGRAVGWYYMALVDVLDNLPADHPGRPELIAIVRELTDAVVRNRDGKTKLWYQVMDHPGREGNYIEGSASAMFIYGMAKSAEKGYIDASYRKTADESYRAAKDYFFEKGAPEYVMQHICGGAGLSSDRDGSFEYYINERITPNDVKGVGPMLLAGMILEGVK